MGALVRVNGGIEKGQWALVRVNGGIEQWGLNGGLVRVNGGIEKGQWGALANGGMEKGQGQTGVWLWVRQKILPYRPYRVASSTLQGCKLYLGL